MKLCIADPPYYGRANRWYGDGCGDGYGIGRADTHPDAAVWDTREAHIDLVTQLTSQFDGWAIAAHASSLELYTPILPPGTRTAIWVRPNALPSGARVANRWEPVFIYIPEDRRGHNGFSSSDVLTAPAPGVGFKGAKPAEWTRWVLAMMGDNPDTDTVEDMFHGSGAVIAAADGMLI